MSSSLTPLAKNSPLFCLTFPYTPTWRAQSKKQVPARPLRPSRSSTAKVCAHAPRRRGEISDTIAPAPSIPAVCSFPVEYCEFGSSLTRCKEWLKEADSALYDKFYSDGVLLAFARCCLLLVVSGRKGTAANGGADY